LFFVEPGKGSTVYGTFWVHSLSFVLSFPNYIFHIIEKHQDPKMYL